MHILQNNDIINHIRKQPFKLVCWEKNIISKITNEQQSKADMYIKNHIHKIEFKEQEENSVLTVPDEVVNIRGFTSIPPFLRVFPSNLALQNVIKDVSKKNTPDISQEISQKDAESQVLKIKNKRDVEDKIVSITLKENIQKSADDFAMSELNRKDSLISISETQQKTGKDDIPKKSQKSGIKNSDMEDLFGEDNDTGHAPKLIEEKGNRDEIPIEVLQREIDEPSDIKTKKRAAKGARKIKELSNLFV